MKSSLLPWFAARAGLAAISASWTCPAGAAGEPAGRPELARCRSVVTHGKARIEIAQTRRLANPAKGSPHVCRAEVTVRGPAYEERRVYADIDPVGAKFGVAILGRPIGRFRAVAKLGDYDGRLLLVDEQGTVADLPGPEHLVAGGRFLVLRHRTDAWLALAIYDLEARELVFAARGEALARLFGSDVKPERLDRLRWLEIAGALHAWLPPDRAGFRGAAVMIQGQDGTPVPATLSPEQLANAKEVSYQGLEGWQDCSCGTKPPVARGAGPEAWMDRGPRGALAAAEHLVRTDFDAVGDHFGLVKPDERSSDPTKGVAFSCLSPALTVVTTYRVAGHALRGAKGSVEVRYGRIGAVERREFRREKERDEVVTLELVYQQGQWWISEPVVAHVAAGALLECHRKHLAELDAAWWTKASPAQRAWAGLIRRNVGELEGLVRPGGPAWTAVEAVHDHVKRSRSWDRGQYRVEEKGREGELDAYWVLHADDAKMGAEGHAGGGKSFGILYDRRRREVVRELWFQ